MRKIEEQMVCKLYNHKKFSNRNTEVVVHKCKSVVLLHEMRIATLYKDGLLIIEDGNYQSNVTKSRLNALPGVAIQQIDYQWYLNGKKWNGDRTIVA